MRTILWLAICCLAVTVGKAGDAAAQFAKAEDAIKYRQSVMSVVGTHFTRLGAMVRGEAPFAREAFEENAALVATLLKLPWEAFQVAGSDKGSSLQPEALSKKEDFLKLARANQDEVAKLLAAAKTGDLNAIRPAFGTAGASCKACHDSYRRK